MDLMSTPLGSEIQRVIDAQAGQPNVYVDATIHTKFGDVGVIRVLNHDVMREYEMQYTDETSLVCIVPAGQYAYKVAPSRNELEITVSSSPMAQHGSEEMERGQFGAQRFRAVLKQSNDPTLESKSRELLGEFTMDVQNFEVLEFQLFHKTMEQFSMASCGGIYRKTSVPDLIRTILLMQTLKADVEDDFLPLGVDMVDPIDSPLRDHIVLPHGIKSYDAPGYIHKHCGGVYSAGLAYYYQDDYWYVFPPYDYKRFSEADRQLVILAVPESKMPGLEQTYLVEGSVTTIIAAGGIQLDDQSDLRKRANGNGLRVSDASKFFEDSVEIKQNKALVSRGKLNNEFLSSPQKSEFNNVQVSPERISANTMYQASRLAAREGVRITLGWQSSDPSLIIPGMQAQVMYYKEGTVRTLNAVVVGVQVATSYEGTGLVTGRYNRNTALHLFAANEANQQEE